MELSVHKVAKIKMKTQYFNGHSGDPFFCRTLAIHDTHGQVIKLHLYASDANTLIEHPAE